MSYTKEDFARARFAVMETEEAGEVLLTRDPDPGVKYRWLTASGGAFTDAEMAEGRCYPVVEADLVMKRQAQAWLEVLDHPAMTNLGRGTGIEGVKRRLDELQANQQKPLPEDWERAVNAEALLRHGSVNAVARVAFRKGAEWALTRYSQQPADLDLTEYLQQVWERAELTEDAPPRKGDLVIDRLEPRGFHTRFADSDWPSSSRQTRVYRRAPQRSKEDEARYQNLKEALDSFPGWKSYTTDELADHLVRAVNA
ncbi:hypothetical protein [Brevibacterium moorei]|uniref:hypothetical protein n=1 Tax=Brevibacterium moorei TaxID=2968457 RepID=UPI00211D1241|nr:hypothetical protein [Brevibacterium sp. 68QC2CO]MCQ9384401.1 hypothetical protein [Brevibacterium sp. 68QC2CO]